MDRHDDLLDELRSLLALIDTMDGDVVDQARRAYQWRAPEANLAELSHDSLLDEPVGPGLRGSPAGPPTVRMLRFVALDPGAPDAGAGSAARGEVTVDLEITAGGGRAALVGQLTPACSAVVCLQPSAGDTRSARADELGQFFIGQVPAGPVRLHVDFPDHSVVTTWLPYVGR